MLRIMNMKVLHQCLLLLWLLVAHPGGCSQDSPAPIQSQGVERGSEPDAVADPVAAAPIDLANFPIRPWCQEHSVPEAVCTRCNPALIPHFQAANDWCAGHDLPESQCVLCNPEVRAKWEAMRPTDTPPARQPGATPPHPQRRLLAPRNDPLCAVDRQQIRFRDTSVVELAGIRIEQVALRRILAHLECPARTEFDQTRLAHVTPRVAGVIREVPARLGDSVTAGTLLAVLESPELGEAMSRYVELRDTCALSEKEFERAESIYRGVRRMLEVVTPEATVESVREKLAEVRIGEARATLLKAHAAQALARESFDREASLHEQGIASEKSYQTARSELLSAEAQFHALHEEIALGVERDRMAAERNLNVARSALSAAKRKLNLLGFSLDQISSLEKSEGTALSRYELLSPIAGTVVQRHAVIGESAHPEDLLFTVAELSTIWLIMDVQERDLVELREALPVLFTSDGLVGKSFEGTTSWVSDQIDERTRTIKVRAELDNESGLLKPNMFGLARVILHDQEELPAVPEESVQSDGCCQLVFVQKAPALFEPRKVFLGSSSNGYVEVIEGVQLGESVVTTGSFLMKTEILKSSIGAGCCEVNPGR